MWPDANAHSRRLPDHPVREINYGQLVDIFYIELNEHNDANAGTKYLLGHVLPSKILKHQDAAEKVVEYQQMDRNPLIINLLSIDATVGRVKRHNTWGIVDRSRDAVRTLFIDDDNAPQAASSN